MQDKWLSRDYYNASYTPDANERSDVEQLAKRFSTAGLQNKTNQHIYNTLLSVPPSSSPTVTLLTSQSSSAIVPINRSDKPKSVILKREPVISYVEGRNETIVELILLNHSFIISLFSEDSPESNSNKEGSNSTQNANLNKERRNSLVLGMTKNFSKSVNVLLGKKTVECCFDLKSIVGIKFGGEMVTDEEGMAQDPDGDENKFTLLLKDEKKNILSKQFICSTKDRKNAWIQAFNVSIMENYKMEQHSLLTAALCNNIPSIITSVESNTLQIDEVDTIHGYTSLHFAIINNNLDIATELLKGGADANIKSKDGLSPLYYAKMMKNNFSVMLLQKFGAEDFTPVLHHVHQTVKIRTEQSHPRLRTSSSSDSSETKNTYNLYANELSFEDRPIHSKGKTKKQLKQKTKKIISGVTNLIAGLSERGTHVTNATDELL